MTFDFAGLLTGLQTFLQSFFDWLGTFLQSLFGTLPG